MRKLSLVAVGVAALCGACVPEQEREPLPFEASGPQAAPDTSTLGPYPVGVRTVTFTDERRVKEGVPRTLTVELWYPAKESARGKTGETISLYDNLPADLQDGLTPDDLGFLTTSAVRDAEPRDDGDTYPVVAFSHGKGGIRNQSNFYTIVLASHGYIVAAPDHAGDTVVELLREVKDTGNIQASSTLEAIVDRPIDIMTMLDRLEDGLGGDDITKLLDLEHVGVTGHSFGAITSFLVASQDFRFDVVVAQAPGSQDVIDLQSRTPMRELTKPSLLQSATLDDTLPEATNAAPLFRTLPGPRAWLSLSRAGHFTYSDLCVLDSAAISVAVNLDVSNVLDDGCGEEALPTNIAFPVINATAIGFFNVHLRGSPGSATFVSQATVDALAAGEGIITVADWP